MCGFGGCCAGRAEVGDGVCAGASGRVGELVLLVLVRGELLVVRRDSELRSLCLVLLLLLLERINERVLSNESKVRRQNHASLRRNGPESRCTPEPAPTTRTTGGVGTQASAP